MSSDVKDLREKRGKLIHDARSMLDKAKDEKRELSSEEQSRWDEMMDEQQKLGEEIRRHERMRDVEREALENAAQQDEERGIEKGTASREERLSAAIDTLFRTGRIDGHGAEEFRALQADADVTGGFLVMPEQFVMQLINGIDDMTFIRQRATTFQVSDANSLGVPTLEADPADADWTTELSTGSEDSSMRFGKRALHPHPLAKRIKISNKLLMRAVMNAEQLVRQRLAYKFGITHEKAFLTGSGSGQPLGIFTASSDGISTSRDVSTGNTSSSIKFDGLMEAKYSLKGQYWANAEWLFHRDAVKQIAKLKDGEGQYIWRESTRAGEPDTLLGFSTLMSEYAPNTFSTGNYVGALGDFSHYWIADAMTMQVQRLNELYAESNQVGFIGRLESDGMPTLEEAFARVKLA